MEVVPRAMILQQELVRNASILIWAHAKGWASLSTMVLALSVMILKSGLGRSANILMPIVEIWAPWSLVMAVAVPHLQSLN
jgi:hypothetical protein